MYIDFKLCRLLQNTCFHTTATNLLLIIITPSRGLTHWSNGAKNTTA